MGGDGWICHFLSLGLSFSSYKMRALDLLNPEVLWARTPVLPLALIASLEIRVPGEERTVSIKAGRIPLGRELSFVLLNPGWAGAESGV